MVRDATEGVVANTIVELRPDGAKDAIVAGTVTGSDGRYRLKAPTGQYALVLAQPGFKRLRLDAINVLSGAEVVLPDLYLQVSLLACGQPSVESLRYLPSSPNVGDLSGTVRVESRQPKVSFDITLICASGKTCGSAKTNRDGAFTLRGIAPGYASIRATATGFYPQFFDGLFVQGGADVLYSPIVMQSCPNGNCNVAPPRSGTQFICE